MNEIDVIHCAQQAALEHTRKIQINDVDKYIEEYEKVLEAVYNKISSLEIKGTEK